MSSAQRVSIGCTMLLGTDKKGILKPDADGYYTVVLGAYGAFNSANMFYDLASAAVFFQPGSPLIRMIEKGVLRGEYKHPEPGPRRPGQTEQQANMEYVSRIRRIDENRIGFHIRKVYLRGGVTDDKGRPITEVIGEVRPSGPFGQVVKDALDNPHENVYFSVRSLTVDDMQRGIKYTRDIVTWDFVNEGGIYNANKYGSPALESIAETEVKITPVDLWSLADAQKGQQAIGLESTSTDYTALAKELGWERLQSPTRKPIYQEGW